MADRRHSAPLSTSTSRRELLARSCYGLGALGLGSLLADTATGQTPPQEGPLAPKAPPFRPRAKRVVHIFCNGGPSHVDTFDHKPALGRYDGRPLPVPNRKTERKTGAAFASPFGFRRYGESGIEVSDLFPQVGSCIDRITVIRSMQCDVPNHEPSLMLMNCGDSVRARPSIGSWVTYGLGTENQNLPGFVVLCPGGYPIKDAANWHAGFLPGIYQGTFVDPKHESVEQLLEHIRNGSLSRRSQRRQLDLLRELNEAHSNDRGGDDPRLEARIQAFELAYRMQIEATDAFDVSREPAAIRDEYGPGVHAKQTLIARRLLERGVRYVQLWHGAGQPWDHHDDIAGHRALAAQTDRPVAALLRDLERRGMLDDTLVIWGGEFGRTPTVELKASGEVTRGRDHNPYGFTVWLAGGGVKGGHVHGATDEFGFAAAENPVHVHDLHATILHLLGFDHEQFTYRWAGRDFRLTDVAGRVAHDVIA